MWTPHTNAGRQMDRKPAGKAKRCGVVPKRRRRGSPWAGTAWTYYRLHDRRDLVVGFKRVAGDVVHYVDLREDHWQVEPIEHNHAIRLSGELPGFAYLRDPEEPPCEKHRSRKSSATARTGRTARLSTPAHAS